MKIEKTGQRQEEGSVRKRLLIRLAVWLSLSTVILFCVVVWWCASEIAEPSRRPVQAYSLPYLEGKAGSGFRVESFNSSGGMPCLVCIPVSTDPLSERAGIIREQLAARGVSLGPAGTIVGNLLILHGRKGMKEDYLSVAERFCAAGFVCVIPDLPGHGSNPERFTTYGVLEAPKILECFNEAVEKYDLRSDYNAVFGQSMGGSEAVHLVTEDDTVFTSMVLLATFDKLETVVRGQTNGLFGSWLGAAVRTPADVVYKWKTGLRFSEIRPVDLAPQVKTKTLVIHGDRDETTPSARGRALFDALPDGIAKEWLLVPDAGHSNVLITDYPVYATMAEWLLKGITPPPGD